MLLPPIFHRAKVEAATSSEWKWDIGQWFSNSFTTCMRVTGVFVQMQASQVHSTSCKSISVKWALGSALQQTARVNIDAHWSSSITLSRGKEQHLWLMLSQQLRCFQASSDEKKMRGGEEGYWGLSCAEERRMGRWRNETATVAETIVHQPGLDRKPGQSFCLFSFLLIYFIF